MEVIGTEYSSLIRILWLINLFVSSIVNESGACIVKPFQYLIIVG
jgi:hypothetical protein